MASLQSYSAIQRILSSPRGSPDARDPKPSSAPQSTAQDQREARIIEFHSDLWARACERDGFQRPLVVLRRAEAGATGGAVVALWQTGSAMLKVMGEVLSVAPKKTAVEQAIERSWEGTGVTCEIELGVPASTTIYWADFDVMVETMYGALPKGESNEEGSTE